MKNKLKNASGFTIIEVLIVLAIAGLIMLIVFLAVPALQRNSRNTQRTNDASLVASAVNECLTNNNGNTTTCAAGGSYLDASKLQQLTTGGGAGLNGYLISFGSKCDNNGVNASSGGGSRSLTVTYQLETTTATPQNRCVGS